MFHLTVTRAGRTVADGYAGLDLTSGDSIDRAVTRLLEARRDRGSTEGCQVEIREAEITIKPGKALMTYVVGCGTDPQEVKP